MFSGNYLLLPDAQMVPQLISLAPSTLAAGVQPMQRLRLTAGLSQGEAWEGGDQGEQG